jgi:hypothetical protein
MKKMYSKVAVMALSLTIFASAPLFAAAEGPVSDTVDALAGLAPVLDLACTPVSFGVWRVPTGARAAVNTVTLTMEDTTTKYTASGSISLGSGATATPYAGVCAMTGSNNMSSTGAALVMTNNTAMAFSGAAVLNRVTPTTSAALTATLATPATVSIDADGAATWYVVGELTIPNNLVTANYGGYQSTTAATATYSHE